MIKKREVHGLISLFLIAAAIMIGVISIFTVSLPMAAAYIAIIFLSFLGIIYSFCSKCACKNKGCGHVIPGIIAGLMPSREVGPYTFPDIGGLVISLILLFGFPQYWLWAKPAFIIIFWIFAIAGIIEIRKYVCPMCSNENCPICVRTPE
jgi:hypothetical protein